MRAAFQTQLTRTLNHENLTPLNGVISSIGIIEKKLGQVETKNRQQEQSPNASHIPVDKGLIQTLRLLAGTAWSNAKLMESVATS